MKSFSPIRFVGGKTRLVPTLLEYLPETCNRYWEPFCGGAALFFAYGYKAKQAYLSDINHPLINTYDHMQCALDEVLSALTNLEETPYDRVRDQFNQLKSHFESCQPGQWTEEDGVNYAALFIAINHLCFNGVYRENKSGGFNVPVGRNSKGEARLLSSLKIDDFVEASKKLKKAQVMYSSFSPWPWSPFNTPEQGDVWFADSPYLDEFSSYTKDGFGPDQHKLIYEQALAHAANGATVIVCGSNNDASRAIYGEPTIVVELSRTVGHSKRKKATEALWVWNGVK
jgi:DNA adenine methylase